LATAIGDCKGGWGRHKEDEEENADILIKSLKENKA